MGTYVKAYEETTTAIAWISFPALPPNFFCDEALFSLTTTVGKPLQVYIVTKNKTRPNCTRVKVEWTYWESFLNVLKLGSKGRMGKFLKSGFQLNMTTCPNIVRLA